MCANAQNVRKVSCSALWPKFADVKIWTHKHWKTKPDDHIGWKGDVFYKSSVSNVRKDRSNFGLLNLTSNMTAFFHQDTWIVWVLFVFGSFGSRNQSSISSFSAPEMKLFCIACINMSTREGKSWHGRKVLCCENGTAVLGKMIGFGQRNNQ